MPDRDHWSASMLLRWVLTRDSDAVLSMINDYGGWRIEGGNVTRTQPHTWDDVIRDYSIDDSLPKEERAVKAVVKAELFVIPARTEIHSSLRRGEIDSWARPNGSGDIVKIEPIQWAGLRFHTYDGHDIAVPVDSEQNPMPLPLPLADYLSGLAPPTSLPTVWPDPLFAAQQAMRLWPPRANSSATPASSQPPKLRGAYLGALEQFIARFKPEVFAGMSDDAVARQFVDYCERLTGAGKPAPPLPRDRRNIALQVEKIRERLAATRSKSAAPDTT